MRRKCCSHEYFSSRSKACNYYKKMQRVACNKLHMKPRHNGKGTCIGLVYFPLSVRMSVCLSLVLRKLKLTHRG